MDEQTKETGADLKSAIREAIQEYIAAEQARAEPAYKTELVEERKRREELERRVNELVQENHKTRAAAEEAQRNATIRTELQRLGVSKVDLAYKAVKDDIVRTSDGRMAARTPNGEVAVREYLEQFVQENPELLPARISGGSGVSGPHKPQASSSVDLNKIRPGMSAEDLARVREEIARIAQQSGL